MLQLSYSRRLDILSIFQLAYSFPYFPVSQQPSNSSISSSLNPTAVPVGPPPPSGAAATSGGPAPKEELLLEIRRLRERIKGLESDNASMHTKLSKTQKDVDQRLTEIEMQIGPELSLIHI